MDTEEKRCQWHPACYAALNLEFKENKYDLEFQQEIPINVLPLRIDTLIIKKKRNCILQNEIGKLFRTHNLVEYKSPDDELNFNTVLKGFIPMQIIVSRELEHENHVWLNSLSKKLSKNRAKTLVKHTNQLTVVEEKKLADSVWEIVTRLNVELIKNMMEDEEMCKAMAEIFKPEIDAAFDNGFNNGVDDKGIHVFKNMIKRGFTKEDAQSIAEISNELVERALAELND